MKKFIKKKYILIFLLLFVGYKIYKIYFRPIEGNTLIDKKSEAYINNLYMSNEVFKEGLLASEDYYIYDTIIENNINGVVNNYIRCTDDCINKFKVAIHAVYLDHPELITFKGIGSFKYQNNIIQYENYFNFSETKKKLAIRRIERELESIRNKTKDMSDKDKIIFVYNYVASHNYDKLFRYDSSNQSAYSFFTGGKSVCAGFAKASQLIFQNIGINSYLVLSTNHMWNYVEYEEKYYIFDATVGTSYTDKNNSNYYDGLSRTTTGVVNGLYSELYPSIESTSLKEIFDL